MPWHCEGVRSTWRDAASCQSGSPVAPFVEMESPKSDDSKRASRTLPSRNIRAIARLENEALHQRSLTDRVSDNITRFAGSSVFIVLHIVWFTIWIILNL